MLALISRKSIIDFKQAGKGKMIFPNSLDIVDTPGDVGLQSPAATAPPSVIHPITHVVPVVILPPHHGHLLHVGQGRDLEVQAHLKTG